MSFRSYVDIVLTWLDLLLSTSLSLKKLHVSIDSSIGDENLMGDDVFGGKEFSAEDIRDILEWRCPNVERIGVSHGDGDQICHRALVPILTSSCPNLRRLKFDAEMGCVNPFEFLLSLMIALPARQLKEVE
ncbi:hypothetical protein BGZ47_002928 [Haplosporangium gracile]|nr:hypothetical protein BGZ47_002928 [Haplosporangium gracile]